GALLWHRRHIPPASSKTLSAWAWPVQRRVRFDRVNALTGGGASARVQGLRKHVKQNLTVDLSLSGDVREMMEAQSKSDVGPHREGCRLFVQRNGRIIPGLGWRAAGRRGDGGGG